jgi:hypothetical protein
MANAISGGCVRPANALAISGARPVIPCEFRQTESTSKASSARAVLMVPAAP